MTFLGRFDAIKSQYPQLIQTAENLPEDTSDDYNPSTPDTLDKENFTMTQILPHIFVGTHCLFSFRVFTNLRKEKQVVMEVK